MDPFVNGDRLRRLTSLLIVEYIFVGGALVRPLLLYPSEFYRYAVQLSFEARYSEYVWKKGVVGSIIGPKTYLLITTRFVQDVRSLWTALHTAAFPQRSRSSASAASAVGLTFTCYRFGCWVLYSKQVRSGCPYISDVWQMSSTNSTIFQYFQHSKSQSSSFKFQCDDKQNGLS